MNKESAEKMMPRRSPRLSREQKSESSTTQSPSPGTAKDGRSRKTKRKASPEQQTSRKRTKVSEAEAQIPSEKDLRIKLLKRKVRDDGEGGANIKRKKRRLDLNQDEAASSSQDTESSSSSSRRRRGKRKAADGAGEGPNSKRTRTQDQKEDQKEENQDHQEANQNQEENQENQQDLTSHSPIVEFEAKYEQQDQLGEGGCGCVFAGFRKADNLPVAIKHIPKDKVLSKRLGKEGRQVSVEVAIMLKLGAGTSGSEGTSAPVSLLDWYDLGLKLILVMERPVPCVDLFDYVKDNGGCLQEKEAKIILKQLVNAAKVLEDQQIFHRDIKRENILIETGSEVPCVRLIDFGLGCFATKRSLFRNFCGTPAHVPPECYVQGSYRAGPTTVWQMGVVLFDTVHRKLLFETTMFAAKKLKINRKLSKDCQNFLKMCLTLDPKERPTLEQLQQHPWLR